MQCSNSSPLNRHLLRVLCQTLRTDALTELRLQVCESLAGDRHAAAPAVAARPGVAAERSAAGFANELALAVAGFHMWFCFITFGPAE